MICNYIKNGLFLYFLSICTYVAAHPHIKLQQSTTLNQEEIEWVKRHPVIRVSNPIDRYPYNFVSDAEDRGLSVDYVKLLLGKVGLKVYFIREESPSVLFKMLKHGQLDILTSVNKTKEGDKFLDYTPPYHTLKLGVFTKTKNKQHVKQLVGQKIGILESTLHLDTFTLKFPNSKMCLIDTQLNLLKSLIAGDVDKIIGDTSSIYRLKHKYSIEDIELVHLMEMTTKKESEHSLCLGIRKNLVTLSSIMEKALKQVSFDERKEIENKWILDVEKRTSKFDPMVIGTITLLLMLYTGALWYTHRLKKTIKSKNDSLTHLNNYLSIEVEKRTLEIKNINVKLQKSIEELKVLQGLIHICASCKKIREDNGDWSQLEKYMSQHSEATFSHAICPDCINKLYPDLDLEEE